MDFQNSEEELAGAPAQSTEGEAEATHVQRGPSLLDPLGLFEGLRRDVERFGAALSGSPRTEPDDPQTPTGETALDAPLPGSHIGSPFRDLALRIRAEFNSLSRALFPEPGLQVGNPGDEDGEPAAQDFAPLSTPRARRQEVLRLHTEGLMPHEIASRVGVTGVRVRQILREEGIEPHPPGVLTARELAARERREQMVAAHHRGLTPRDISQELEVSLPLVYRALAEAGLRPNVSAEVAQARVESQERLQQMLQLRQAGVSGAEIARRLGISEPRVVQILREFRAPPPPKRSAEFEQRAFDILPQVESLRRDSSEENIRLTELMLSNLAEEAGNYVASLPEFPRPEMEEERWRAAFVRQQARRALEEMETFLVCQRAMKEAEVTALPALVERARRCIDRAVGLLRQCCPPPPRPSPLKEPMGV